MSLFALFSLSFALLMETSYPSFEYKIFADYLKIHHAGVGGFSSVYSAIHNLTGARVAIKQVLKSSLRTENNIRNFKREVHILQKADHPFIAHFYDFIETEKCYYLVMEYANNGTLLNYLNSNGQLKIDEMRRVFSQVVSALCYMHKNLDIIHRDLKLENIMFDENYNVRLIDFGLSCEKEMVDDKFKTLCGSYPYAAPEIFKQIPYSNAIDIWSLGVCMYAAAFGRLPFYDQNTTHLISMILNQNPSFPMTFNPTLCDLIQRMLTKDDRLRITLDEIIKHPFFEDSQLNFYNNCHFLNVVPNEKTGLDPEVAQYMITLGMNPKNSLTLGTKEFVYYRIMRKEKIKYLITNENVFTQENPIIKKGSAPVVSHYNQEITRNLRKAVDAKSSLIVSNPPIKCRRSIITNKKYASKKLVRKNTFPSPLYHGRF